MSLLTVSMFVLNQGFPQMFGNLGQDAGNFIFGGPDPDNGENELLSISLDDGTYYLLLDLCDDGGRVTGRTLERLNVVGGDISRTEIAKTPNRTGDAPDKVIAAFEASLEASMVIC